MIASTIELNDIGPVEHLSIPIPEHGGIVVLRGANGCGKSSTLKAIDRLATGKETKLTPRDGTSRGEMSGLGVTVRVARSVTRAGELECESLDGRLSVAELVDPRLKGPEENDARRIRALVQLAGVKPDVSFFRGLLADGATFDEVVKSKNLETDDILVLADRIKRAFDEAARGAEGQANVEQSKAAACKESARDVNTKVETDDDKLQGFLEDAIRRDTSLKSKRDQAAIRNGEILRARQKIVEATSTKDGQQVVSLEEAQQRETYAHNDWSDALEAEEKALAALESARANLKRAGERWQDAKRELGSVERFHETIEELEKVVAAGEMESPNEAEMSEASDAVWNCRASIELGVLARRALEKLGLAAKHTEAESAALKKAESLREAAKRIDDVLSDQIAKLGVALQVKNARLVLTTKRGVTLYADLSEGERWKIALDIAIEAVGHGGLLTIPQEAFESLDPTNRSAIAEHVRGRGVVILTAESTDGPIRAEIDSIN